jgi:site-specific DNA-methyltransferase (adenine-specific)
MPLLRGVVDLVVTDPPYGIDFRGDGYTDIKDEIYSDKLRAFKDYPICLLQYPEEMMRYIVPIFGAPSDVLAWCYNSNTNRQHRLWGFWNCEVDFGRVKVPCKNPNDPRVNQLVSSYDWVTDFQQVKNVSAEKTDHPCQIPVGIVKRVLSVVKGDPITIFDPFLGSGTTLVACKELGRKGIGIEINEKYCAIAKKRLQNTIVPML